MISAPEFEDRIRSTASILWSREVEKYCIAGVNLDCVLKVTSGRWVVVEITKEHKLDKVRVDINRLSMARSALFTNNNIMADCYMVMLGKPTVAMTKAGDELHVRVMSFERFERQLFNYENYRAQRLTIQFGSSVNPLTGDPDTSAYVPVEYINLNGTKLLIKTLAELIRKGRKIILIGQYGSGKSRCIRELFSILSSDSVSTGIYYLAIDLRKAWGLQSASEVLRRHMEDLGLSVESDRLIRAFNAGRVCFLLDGFDELGSQAWSNNSVKLQNIRYETLSGVRELVEKNQGGLLVCGRDQYFNGDNELFRSLGIQPNNGEVIKCKDEFSESEMDDFFERVGIDVPVPDWLPKRPLMCQAIASLDGDDLLEMLEADDGDIKFWHKFMGIVCIRESRIKSSLDPDTILSVLKELAKITRGKPAGVGPISLSEVQRAFEAVLGREPVEGASVMLQRLPGLGRTEAESDDRKFIDDYIVDGLRALDVVDSIRSDNKIALRERWVNPLHVLGQRVLANEIDTNPTTPSCLRFANRAIYDGNTVLASDIVTAILQKGLDTIDFGGVSITNGYMSRLDLSVCEPKRLSIVDSIIDQIVFPKKPITGILITRSIIEEVVGISGPKGLPDWVVESEVTKYDSVINVSGIKNIRISIQHRILITILKKTFFQKGSGRQEDALLRGLGQIDRHGYTKNILSYLVSNKLLEEARGDHGKIYVPNRTHKNRIGRIISELNMSTDDIWTFVRGL